MVMRRFLLVLLVACVAESLLFAAYYDDLLYLRRAPATLTDRERAAFEANATAALSRDALTRRHLDTLAQGAEQLGLVDIEVRTLERWANDDPDDLHVRLRLADALRRAGHLERAEGIYVTILTTAEEAQ